jgi:hypothetical protein
LAVLDWERTGTAWTPKLRVLHPQFLRWDPFRGKFIYSAQEGEFEVNPGDGRWVLLTDGQRGWMRGLVRPCAVDWIAKQLTIRDWNRYCERHGLPILSGAFAPAIAEEADQEAILGGRQSDPVRGGGAAAVAPGRHTVPSSTSSCSKRRTTAGEAFEKLLDRIDRRFMILWLGSNLSTEITTQGSQAASSVHRGVEAVEGDGGRRRSFRPTSASKHFGRRSDSTSHRSLSRSSRGPNGTPSRLKTTRRTRTRCLRLVAHSRALLRPGTKWRTSTRSRSDTR